MSSVEERFCLRWNDFESNVCSGFKDIREDQDFLDVTLACGDNKQIQAHKVILSACSPFFRCILKNNPHQHPLLYLKGVKYEEVKSVLDFMYYGEVNVAQEDLSSFLSVAKELEVKGLTQVDKEENNKDCIQNRRGRNKSVDDKIRKKSSNAFMSQEKYIQNDENETAVIADINEEEIIADKDSNRQIKTEQSVIMDCDASQEILAEPTEDVNNYQAYNSNYAYDHEYVDDQFGSGEQQGNDLAQGTFLYTGCFNQISYFRFWHPPKFILECRA